MDNDTVLSSLFKELVQRSFHQMPAVDDAGIKAYIAELLADFARSENLYRVRDARGSRLEDVGEMMIQSNPLLDAPSFDREREIRKHIGDFTLFFTGMFPESIGRWRMRSLRLDSFVDYVRAGKESYHIVAAFDQCEYAQAAPLFRQLSAEFEQCVYSLSLIRRELDIGHPHVSGGIREIIM